MINSKLSKKPFHPKQLITPLDMTDWHKRACVNYDLSQTSNFLNKIIGAAWGNSRKRSTELDLELNAIE